MDLDDFQPIPPEDRPPAVKPLALDEKRRMLVDWITTPSDLRNDGEKSLGGWARAHNISPNSAMKWLQEPAVVAARKLLATEKGMLDYKIGVILDAAYNAGLKGDQRSQKMFLDHYAPQVADHVERTSPKPAEKPPEPPKVADMTDEEIEAQLERIQGASNG